MSRMMARTGTVAASGIDIPVLDARIHLLYAKVSALTSEKSAGFVVSFREWYDKWVQWRNEVTTILLGGTDPNKDPVIRDRFKTWEKDEESWEQGYSFVYTGMMPVRYDSVSSPASKSTRPMVVLAIFGSVAVVLYLFYRS